MRTGGLPVIQWTDVRLFRQVLRYAEEKTAHCRTVLRSCKDRFRPYPIHERLLSRMRMLQNSDKDRPSGRKAVLSERYRRFHRHTGKGTGTAEWNMPTDRHRPSDNFSLYRSIFS